MKLGTLLAMMIFTVWFVGTVEAGLVFVENFETGKLDEKVWALSGDGVGGEDGGRISDEQAYSGTYSWWVGSMTHIDHKVEPALPTASVYIWFYDNAKEPNINAIVMGCSGPGNWMYMGICTTQPQCPRYYYRSVEDGELCLGSKDRKTGWHLFAYIIDGGALKAYIDGDYIEDCPMPEFGNVTIFHDWVPDQFLTDGGFVDDIFIFDDVRDPAKEPSSAVSLGGKLAVTWASLKKQ